MSDTLRHDERLLALATKRDVQAARGLEACSAETGLSTSQLSRCCSPNHRDSLTIRDVATITALGGDEDGHPYVVKALARIAGGVFVKLPDAVGADSIEATLIEIASEFGDVAQAVRAAMADREWSRGEIADALDELDQLDAASARMRHALQAQAALLAGER